MLNLNHTQIIQMFIDKYNYKSYLEIGIELGVNYNKIKCKSKAGVDPDPECQKYGKNIFCMTSDEFFELSKANAPSYTYDLVFVDGLHENLQAVRDIYNAIDVLNAGGTIIVHDCCPENEAQQIMPRQQSEWTGNVWRAWLNFRKYYDLKMYVINCDYGVGVIRKTAVDNKETLDLEELGLDICELPWKDFEKNKVEWLNLKDEVFPEEYR